MKKSHTPAPDIIKNIHPVTLQSGPMSHDADVMQIPDHLRDIPRAVVHLLSDEEQAICDSATD